MRSTFGTRVAGSTMAAWLAGCPSEPEGECDGEGPVTVEVTPNHGNTSVIVDGGEVSVFIAPQGGVFTELDIHMAGVMPEGIASLRVHFTDTDTEPPTDLADASFAGSGLPTRCAVDDRWVVDDTPVGFSPDFALEDLDGRAARLEVTLEGDEPWQDAWEIVLRVIEL